MKAIAIAVTMGLAGVLTGSPAHAGIYLTPEVEKSLRIVAIPTVGPNGASAAPLTVLGISMSDVMQVRDDTKDSEKRRAYLSLRDRLREKHTAGTASLDDKINLGAVLIRLGEFSAAIELLQPLGRDRTVMDFRVPANLGMAYLLSGESRSAADNIGEAIRFLEKAPPCPGLSSEQLAWYLESERALQRLIRLRRQEAGPPGGGARPVKEVDDLLGIRFVGDSGEYEAGKLATAEREKLVKALAGFQGKKIGSLSAQEREQLDKNALKHATALIQQLLYWMPEDTRLYWLLGELLSAQGQVREAAQVLNQCCDARRLNADTLRLHRRTLEQAVAEQKDTSDLENPAVAKAPDVLPATSKLLWVGGGVGVVVILLGYLQVREMRRRRQARA